MRGVKRNSVTEANKAKASYYMQIPQELHTRAKMYVASFPQSASMNLKRLFVEALEYYLDIVEDKSHEPRDKRQDDH